jgi:hypothetical protein
MGYFIERKRKNAQNLALIPHGAEYDEEKRYKEGSNDTRRTS